MGKSNEFIKFKKINAVKTVYIYHKRSYKTLSEAFGFILDYVNKITLLLSIIHVKDILMECGIKIARKIILLKFKFLLNN